MQLYTEKMQFLNQTVTDTYVFSHNFHENKA